MDSTLLGQDSKSSALVYHIYHTGSKKHNFSVHTISDSRTILTLDEPALSNVTTGKGQHPLNDDTLFERRNTWSSIPTKVKRGKYLETRAHDPRTETSPYYVHLPTLYGHCPPYTLRHGGTKRAPPAGLMHQSLFWRKWTMQFGDVLAEDGVIDGRGVVNIKYGTKNGEHGTLKGHSVRGRRYMGESGKEWHAMQNTLPEDNMKHMSKLKPEEVVHLAWAAPLSTRTREYHFRWRDFAFKWKGTKNVGRAQNIFQPFMRYAHLKLVVVVPGRDVNVKEEELLLAQYTCVPASRKAGRLELYQDTIDSFLVEHIHDTFQLRELTVNEKKSLAQVQHSDIKSDQRLRDVLVASAMCMIISEYQKRQVIIQLILLALNATG
ncbi:uncharacterized protein LY89DRAFT_187736 [Mollisia scopiformis]|uniref:Uncharacterized protein n=1 Tax=Mollisia scopiformis TaxID=149040 RepID=A0A194XV71_MOLSC|nr:uncharacterized protein LY89DRAFT_187736 [Mollisia scopiformis]KUJ23607.1 hypothetical protein LY89DRAFT_187736 [Mollisia scopiformis]